MIISVACADGKIDPAEIKQLEKIYASLGLDSSAVTSDIHRLSTAETTPTATLQTPSATSGAFSLDERILARHESDTTDVRQLLNTIFTEDEPADESPAEIRHTLAQVLMKHIINFTNVCRKKNAGRETKSLSYASSLI